MGSRERAQLRDVPTGRGVFPLPLLEVPAASQGSPADAAGKAFPFGGFVVVSPTLAVLNDELRAFNHLP